MVEVLFEVRDGATSCEVVVRAEFVRNARVDPDRLFAAELFGIGEEVGR